MEKKEEKLLHGIRMKYISHAGSTSGSFNVKFFVDEGKRSKTFISNREIREAIGQWEKATDQRGRYKNAPLGEMYLTFNPKTNIARWLVYHPFGPGKLSPERVKIFRGRGIAQLLEYSVVREMKRRFPTLKGFSHPLPRRLRQEQLEKRVLGTNYTYEEAINALRKKIAADTKRHRGLSEKRTEKPPAPKTIRKRRLPRL